MLIQSDLCYPIAVTTESDIVCCTSFLLVDSVKTNIKCDIDYVWEIIWTIYWCKSYVQCCQMLKTHYALATWKLTRPA